MPAIREVATRLVKKKRVRTSSLKAQLVHRHLLSGHWEGKANDTHKASRGGNVLTALPCDWASFLGLSFNSHKLKSVGLFPQHWSLD